MDKTLIYSLLARIINPFVSVKKNNWVFASDYGNLYREGSKYLFEYMCKNHSDYNCTFIVRNKDTFNQIQDKGFPVKMNYSLKGILTIASASCVFTTQDISDIRLAYKKKNRKFYYLNHGQSLKRQMKALENSNIGIDSLLPKKDVLSNFVYKLKNWLAVGYTMDDVEFVSANSAFFVPFMKKSYGEDFNIKILGMPRNDALFDHEQMKNERWITEAKGKFVITYMPTHRKYGLGDITPIPFASDPQKQKWMKENNVIFVMKQHPNMASKNVNNLNSEVIIDITSMGLDPQVVIYNTDILISDYSSVWLDFLLLRRPLISYLYDDFEENDAGVNFNVRKDTPGELCTDEDSLFDTIKNIFYSYDSYKPSDEVINKFYQDPDGFACERYYQEITKK